MKTIWSIVGVLIILILVLVIYRGAMKNRNGMVQMPMPVPQPTPVATTPVVTKQIEQVVVTPVIVPISNDCRSQSYRDNLNALWATYESKRAAYKNEIATSGPNAIALYKEMNDAYNAWYRERRKCLVII